MSSPTTEFVRIFIHDPSPVVLSPSSSTSPPRPSSTKTAPAPASPSPATTLLSAATSAAFKLTSTTTSSEIVAQICKKFKIQNTTPSASKSSGSLVIVCTISNLPTGFIRYEDEVLFNPNNKQKPRSNSVVVESDRISFAQAALLVSSTNPNSFSVVKTLKPSDKPLDTRALLIAKLDGVRHEAIEWSIKNYRASGRDSVVRSTDGGRNSITNTGNNTSFLDFDEDEYVVRWFYKEDEAMLDVDGYVSGCESSDDEDEDENDGNLLPAPRDVLKSGFMNHKSAKDDNVYRRKSVLLTDDKLYVTSRVKGGRRSKNVISIPLARTDLHTPSPNSQYMMDLHTASKIHTFCVQSRIQCNSWMEGIGKIINVSSDNDYFSIAEMIVGLGTGVISDLVRFTMSIQSYKEHHKHIGAPIGPSWMSRMNIAKKWNEVNSLALLYFSDASDITINVDFDVRFEEVQMLKGSIVELVNDSMDRLAKGEKADEPDVCIFDGLLDCMNHAARENESLRDRGSNGGSGGEDLDRMKRREMASVGNGRLIERRSEVAVKRTPSNKDKNWGL